MEFVTQLWVYDTNKFLLNLPCPDIFKNHVWGFLLLLKTFTIGGSIIYFTPSSFHSIQPEAAPWSNYIMFE